MRSMKKVGLLFVSVTALTAFFGTSAAAAEKFTAEKGGQTLSTTLVENHVFSVEGSNVECEEIGFAGVTEGAETETQTVSPSYDKCTAFGFAGASVIENGCEFRLAAVTVWPTEDDAPFELDSCGNGSTEAVMKGMQIEVSVPFFAKCVVDTPEQTISEAVRYTNGEGGLRVEFAGFSITSTVTTSTGLCPLTVGTSLNDDYDGTSIFSAPGGFGWDA